VVKEKTMNVSDTGKYIRELRIKAGYTQKTLSDALHVTDKAISKWERGICLPDTTILPKLSLLLDVDVEMLISRTIDDTEWVGVIDIPECDFAQPVYDKPLVYYLLSHYLLLGITNICFITDEKNEAYLSSDKFKKIGFNFSFERPLHYNLIVFNHPWFLFGSDLTQQFQGAMIAHRTIKFEPKNQEPVCYFIPADKNGHEIEVTQQIKKAHSKTLGRGMVCFDMDNYDRILDVAEFVRTYQKNSGLLIGSLEEIAFNAGIITYDQLCEIAKGSPYKELLMRLYKPQVG